MVISKASYNSQLDLQLKLNRDSITTIMHIGYGGVVTSTFARLLGVLSPNTTKGSGIELLACMLKAMQAWLVRVAYHPFITTPIRQQSHGEIRDVAHPYPSQIS